MRYFLCVSCIVPVFAIAQNYQPLNSLSLEAYYQDENFGSGEDYNMWGTRIDSFEVNQNGDTALFNYLILRDTLVEDGYEHAESGCAWWNAPNWNGIKTVITPNGISYFFNQYADTIAIHHAAAIDSSWIAYRYQNGDRVIAQVESIGWAQDDWLSDSVKVITLSRQGANGVVIPDMINQMTLELYKNHGFRRTTDFVRFPFFSRTIKRVDLSVIDSNAAPFKDVSGTQHPEPHVGDIVTREFGWSQSPGIAGSVTSTSSEIIELSGNPSQGYLVTARVSSQNRTTTLVQDPDSPDGVNFQTVVSPLSVDLESYSLFPNNDGFQHLWMTMDANMMPRENWTGYHLDASRIESCGAVVSINTCTGPIHWNNSEPCLNSPIFFECLSGENRSFNSEFGLWSEGSFNADPPGVSVHQTFDRVTFWRNGTRDCGAYSVVSIGNAIPPTLSVWPNPAHDFVRISLSETGPRPVTVRLKDLNGRNVLETNRFTGNEPIRVSGLLTGIYMIEIQLLDGTEFRQRLLIER